MKIKPSLAHSLLAELLSKNLSGDVYRQFHERHRDLMLEMPASVNRHHSFTGGYAVHIFEVVRNILSRLDSAVFPVADKKPARETAVIAAYVHDLDKLFWRYTREIEPPTAAQVNYARSLGIAILTQDTKATLSCKIDAIKSNRPLPNIDELPLHTYRKDEPSADDSGAVLFLCQEHGLPGITREVLNAVSLHHGGWAPLARASSHLVLTPLAVLLHAADQESAVIQNGEC